MHRLQQPCSIAKKIGLGSKDLNMPCEDFFLPLLANFVHPWREVFASLLTPVELDDIDSENNGRSEQEKRIAALRKWKARNGHGATYEILVMALLNIGKVDQAETMCGQLLTLKEMKAPISQSSEIPWSTTVSRSLPSFSFLTPPPSLGPSSPALELYSPCSIDEQIEHLDEEYTEIESLVLDTIKKCNIPHKTVLKWVQILPIKLKGQFSEMLRTQAKELTGASSVDELFMILSPYWNTLHPTLLEHLIKKLADENLNARIRRYLEELRKFRIHTRLGDFIEKWVGGIPPGFDEFTMELGEEWREKTVEDLEQFRIRLSRQQCIGGHMMYTKKVTSGSVLVVFALPQCCFPMSFEEDTHNMAFLREEHALGVYVGGQIMLELRQPEKPSGSQEEEEMDEIMESDIEFETVVIGETTALSDSGSEVLTSLVYLYDVDAEYDNLMQAYDAIDGALAYENTPAFPSLSYTSLRFLSGTRDGVDIFSHPDQATRFRLNPIRRTGEFEIETAVKSSKDIVIGLERRKSFDYQTVETSTYNESCCTLVCGAVLNYLKRNTSINIGYSHNRFSQSECVNRIGLKITRDGALEFFMNGQSLGIADETAYKLGHKSTYYPMVELSPGNNRAMLTAGAAQTEVLSLQQICIDRIAESLKSSADVQLLPLSERVKEKVAKVVFDPDIDFCFNPLSHQELQRNPESDILLCLDDYKRLICAVR